MPLSTSEDFLYDTIKGLLTMTGGALGAGSGLLSGGTTSIPGAIVGAGLGGGMGESIKNYAKANQNIPVNLEDILKAIPVGASQEAGGQMIGKGLGYAANKIIDKAAPVSNAVQEILSSLKKSPTGKLETVFHGSAGSPIPNPVAQSNFSLGGQVFHTTPEQYVAEDFANLRKYRDAPSFEEAAKVPAFINEYYQKIVPELHLNYNSATQIGKQLGLSLPQAEEAMSAALPRGEYRLWPEILKQRAQEPSFVVPDEITEIGQQAADILKNQGIRRLSKAADVGPEIYNWHPEQDLFHKPTWDYALRQEQGQNDLNQLGKEAAQALINSFSTSLANTPRSK